MGAKRPTMKRIYGELLNPMRYFKEIENLHKGHKTTYCSKRKFVKIFLNNGIFLIIKNK